MNTQDYKPISFTWPEVFEKQRELKFLYEPDAKGVYEDFDIDCYEDQEVFKKYCWRIVEELVETEEAYYEGDQEHIGEELIDAMNFAIELTMLYGWSSKYFYDSIVSGHLRYSIVPNFSPSTSPLLTGIQYSIFQLGLTANCLKNRQWRRSQYLVDLLVFEERFKDFLFALYDTILNVFQTDEGIRQAWSLKYQVNHFRIQTNY